MSILEQDEIDRQVAIIEKRRLADSAIEKITEMYENVTGDVLLMMLEDMESIGFILRKIKSSILPKNEHFNNFERLRTSYNKRGYNI